MSNPNNWLDDKQYEALQLLYHDFRAAFNELPQYMKTAYYTRMYDLT